MVGRFAHALRTQRTISPRRKRALLVMAAVSLLGVVTVVLTLYSPDLPGGMGAAGSAIMMHAKAQAQEKQNTVRSADKAAAAEESVSAEIVTCPACRLNSLPKVKAFVHGDAKLFPALKVTFQFGHDPHLYLHKDGKQVADVDLAPLDGAAIMQRLYKHGIRPSTITPSITAALGRSVQLASQ